MTWNSMYEIHIHPDNRDWTRSEEIRDVVRGLLQEQEASEAFVQNAAMVTKELVENIIKYSDWSQRKNASFWMEIDGQGDAVRLRTTNAVRKEDSHVRALMGIINRMREITPSRAFAERLQELLRERGGLKQIASRTGSRLGLLRMADEGACEVEANVDELSILHVQATLHASEMKSPAR